MDVIKVKQHAEELVSHLQAEHKISAIKAVRAITNCGLLEAKEIVEACYKAWGKPNPHAPLVSPNQNLGDILQSALQANAEHVVVCHDDYETYAHTFHSEFEAMEYAKGRSPQTSVQVAKIIAKTEAVTTYTLKRV